MSKSMYQAELFPVVSHALKKKNVDGSTNDQFAPDRGPKNEVVDSLKTDHAVSPFPAIPPKTKTKLVDVPDDDEENWFFVHSPREEHGAEGPYGLEDLRNFKKIGVLQDTTLMWQNGLKTWLPLQALPLLKKQLIKLPPIPTRNDELTANDPVGVPPTRDEVVACEKLDKLMKFNNSQFCSRCGSTAVGHLPMTGEQNPDVMLLRHSVGNYKNAIEVIPGLLWIGNASTGRSKIFLDLGADLIINCTDNLKSPESKPPTYRCKTIPLPEVRTVKEGDSPTKKLNKTLSMEELMDFFDQFFDHIEYCRLYPERAKEGDLVPPEYRGPVDRYGRPLRSKEEQAIFAAAKKVPDDSAGKAARILLWSRLGFDRPCALTAAYLIRKWGMTVQASVDYVSANRVGTIISPLHMDALEQYSLRHTLGDLLCRDCLSSQSVPMVTFKETDSNGLEEIKAVRVSAPINTDQEELCRRISSAYESSPCKGRVGVDLCTSFFFHRPIRETKAVLMDVKITGRSLSDSELTNVVEVFETCGVLPQLHSLDFSENRFSCAGTTALCNALKRLPSTELSVLNLKTNRIGPEGGEALSELLYPQFSLTTLILGNNRIGDKGGYAIANAMVIAEKEYFDDELHVDPDSADNAGMYGDNQREVTVPPAVMDDEHIIQNCTITYLDLSNNNIAGETFEALSFVLKSNKTLISLNIDFSIGVKGNDLNHVFNNCRVFNSTLRRLSIADTNRVAVNTFDNAMRIFQGFAILESISFARCELTSLHLKKSIAKISSSKYLTELDLSGNKLGDQGISFLAEAMIESEGNGKLPLRRLDISSCGITINGALEVTDATTTKHTMEYLDMSDNDLSGEDDGKFSQNVRNSRYQFLGLNRCQLGTKKASELLSELKYVSTGTCGGSLKALLMSENNIQDTIDESLYCFLSTNKKVELLDLGFNKITEDGVIKSKTALHVSSSASAEVKVSELHINMIGNRCNPFALEHPGKGRAKLTMKYAKEHFDDPYHHVSADSVNEFVATKSKFSKLSQALAASSVQYNIVS